MVVADLGNDDPPEKKARDADILQLTLAEQAHSLSTREPMLNYADAELCGKWKVDTHWAHLI